MHQIDSNDAELDSIFLLDDDERKLSEPIQEGAQNVGRNGGRKSILEVFPDIPVIATSNHVDSKRKKGEEIPQ